MSLAAEFLKVPVSIFLSSDIKRVYLADIFGDVILKSDLPSPLTDFFESVFSLSPYLKSSAKREQAFIREILSRGFEACVKDENSKVLKAGFTAKTEAELMAILRVHKRRVALICGLADLGGWWHGEKVTQTLSEFACAALKSALNFILLQHHRTGKIKIENLEEPQENCGLVVLGMGKLGAGELNYSSDIDLILFYEAKNGMTLNTDDPITLLSRFAKQLIKIMQERTSDGYVFRMDLRLRPDPSSTPLVLPIEAALNYYEGQGQNWERAAMIKAQPVAGDLETGRSFLAELSPFIWRKYLDYAAINDIHSIKRQINSHKGFNEISVSGHNVKLGRGGIREIEFFVQTQQLIAGGRTVSLRTNQTIEALEELEKLGWVTKNTSQELALAYWFLRNIEHRLQMVSDAQTHTLPTTLMELSHIAHMCGYADVKQFEKEVRETLTLVSKHYTELFETAENLSDEIGNLVFTGDENDPDTIVTLKQFGFENPESIIKTVKHWHVAKFPALRATRAREMLTELIPTLLRLFGKTEKPDDTLLLFDRFISGLPAGIQLFSILQNNPALSGLILNILTSAPRLAKQIAHKPHVFDAMLDPSFANNETDTEELLKQLLSQLERAVDYESALDAGRRFFSEATFLYGYQFFSGIISLDELKTALSNLGDVMVRGMYLCVSQEFVRHHGNIANTKVCILGMGRLGSKELTATSDLDLIFLYDYNDENAVSDGAKQLPVSLYFARLMQRFITAMSSQTSEGIIYNLDFRLRPSGNAGPLATPIDGFLRYQREEAWVWEAQALTRARPIVGDASAVTIIADEIPKILKEVSKRKNIKSEIMNMRKILDKEKPAASTWDVKNGVGGLVDIEFIAQYFTLTGKTKNAIPCKQIISALPDNHLSKANKEKLLEALFIYENIMHLQRICLGELIALEKAPLGFIKAILQVFDLPDIKTCKSYLTDLRAEVRKVFIEIIG